MSRYRLIHAERATYPVAVLCRTLRVSRAGYYAWASRGASTRAQADEDLAARVAQCPELHDERALGRQWRVGRRVGTSKPLVLVIHEQAPSARRPARSVRNP